MSCSRVNLLLGIAFLFFATFYTFSLHPSTTSNVCMEQTFIMVKPDGVERALSGTIIEKLEHKGYKLVAAKLMKASKELLEEHYRDLSSKGFFQGLIEYMSSGPVLAMVFEGKNAVKVGRALLGATNPADSAPGTIRGDYAVDIGRNICHGSDSVESAQREIALWFSEGVLSYSRPSDRSLYE